MSKVCFNPMPFGNQTFALRTFPPLFASFCVGLSVFCGAASAQSAAQVFLNDQPLAENVGVYLTPDVGSIKVRVDHAASATEKTAPGNFVSGSDGNGPVATQSIQTTYTWWADTGGISLGTPGEILYLPNQNGQLSTLSVNVETSNQRTLHRQNDPQSDTPPVADSELTATVRILPAVRFDREGDGTIEGSVIGIYPNEFSSTAPGPVQRNPEAYAPPAGFYRLDEATSSLNLSPHTSLGMLNPEVLESSGPRFIALNPKIVEVFESLCQTMREEGQDASSLRVLRGFVSPNERNRLERLGVTLAEFTRYQYGDALSIIVDKNNDFRMDDLNLDGKIDMADSEWLADRVEQAMQNAGLLGGIGVCASFEGPNHIGTPYVHMDVRGWPGRWTEQ